MPFLVMLVQFAVCFLILKWLLKQKTGEPFSKKSLVKFLLLGALGLVLGVGIMSVLPLDRDTFFGMNPLLSGFVTALITAALAEEIIKYIMFRLAIRNNAEVKCWLDVIIAAVVTGIGFTLMEDLEFLVSGDANIARAFIPGHLLFQAIMGYYYGKARVTKERRYDVLSLAVPVLAHTVFDMFLIGMLSILGNEFDPKNINEEAVMALPYANYLLPMLVCAIVVFVITVIALILVLRKIGVWSKNGEKQELL
ncbi:MAG: PrsW family intramembrane metalloprotease [Firmicutes bacterium]|nr:PrsW family intramembrane metalloprotease [Bacillota bacterium]